LEDSKVRVIIDTSKVPPGHPFRDPKDWRFDHPANPFHPDYVSPAGERARNGYPSSSWAWITVNREWWAVLRTRLWSRLVLRGASQYKGFLRLIDDPDSRFIRDFVQTVVLGEGAEDPFQMYAVLRAVPAANTIVYKPWPKELHLGPFGVHVIPTNPGPSAVVFPGIPFDRVTNTSTRQHLRTLPRLQSLDLRLDTLSTDIGQLFATLPHLRRLALRLPSLHPVQLAPFATPQTAHVLGEEAGGAADEVQAQDGRAPLEALEIKAAVLHDDVLPDLRAFLAADSRLGPITTIIRGQEEEVVYAPVEQVTLAHELAEAAAEATEKRSAGAGEQFVRGSILRVSGTEGREHWQRETIFRFGKLITLRLESKK
jgi:hypothetical protein